MDDIEKSFGGESVDSNRPETSSNAYMLLYRQIDLRRNKNAMIQEEFPPHIKDLHNTLKKKLELSAKLSKEKEQDLNFKVPVYLMECSIKKIFMCYKSITVDQLKDKAIEVLLNSNLCLLILDVLCL